MKVDATYAFITYVSFEETFDLVRKAIAPLATIKQVEERNGYLFAEEKLGFLNTPSYYKYEFYVGRPNRKGVCLVKMEMRDGCGYNCGKKLALARDDKWDEFLENLFAAAGTGYNGEFGVTLARGDPYIVRVVHLGEQTRKVYWTDGSSSSSAQTRVFPSAFSDEVAYSFSDGWQNSRTVVTTEQDKNIPARLLYNNGRVWEGTVKRGSKLYNQIMVNYTNPRK